jgi:hypothetical protein
MPAQDQINSILNTNFSVVYEPTASLKPWPRNARTHTKRQIRQISESIRVFGFTNPSW